MIDRGHRWHAALYDPLTKAGEKGIMAPVRRFVAGEAQGRVLEIGCGTGANLAYYDWRRVQSLDATEPDPFMLRRAEAKVKELPEGVPVAFHNLAAEKLPFPDGCFDTVVASLVLCTVGDMSATLAELRRVLKADGQLRFVEHVRADGLVGRAQDLFEPVWGWFAAGCHPNRRTEAALLEAGFALEIERRFNLRPGLPAILGVATVTATP